MVFWKDFECIEVSSMKAIKDLNFASLENRRHSVHDNKKDISLFSLLFLP